MGTAALLVVAGSTLVSAPAEAQATAGATTVEEPYAVVDRAPADLAPAGEPSTETASDDPADGAAPSNAGGAARLATQVTDVESFTMIGLSASTASPDDAFVRIHNAQGWQPWEPISLHPDAGPTPGSDEEKRSLEVTGGVPVGEPLWVGSADGYEVNVPGDTTDAKVLVVREETREVTAPAQTDAMAIPTQGQPTINPRTSWGARAPKVAPIVAPALRFAIVHHSVSTNNYSPAQVPAILRSIQAFHMDGNGWDDIGYNFAIDRYGSIWEARSGGITRAVIGAHAFEDNYQSAGIVGIGEFDSQGPTSAMLNAYSELIGWKLQLHGWQVDQPWNGHPAIVGHRDVNQTACPGQLLYNQLGTIRAGARAKQAQMRAIPGFWGGATIHRNADGRLEVFSLRNDNTVWHSWQIGGGWSPWYPLLGGVTGQPTVATNPDGRLEVFAVSTNGTVVHIWQYLPNSGWSSPHGFGGATVSPTSGIAVENNPDGRLEIFAVTDTDVLSHMYQWPGAPGVWSGWYGLGEGFPSNAGLDAIANPDGRLEIFANSDGHVVRHAFQYVPNGGWSPMYSLDMPGNGGPSVVRNADGRLEVMAVDDNGVLWHRYQFLPNSGWAAATPLAAGFDYGSPVATTPDAAGRVWVFGTNSAHALQSMHQVPTGWTGPNTYGGPAVTGVVDAAVRSDNRLMVAAMERSGSTAYIATENTPGGSWSGLSPLG